MSYFNHNLAPYSYYDNNNNNNNSHYLQLQYGTQIPVQILAQSGSGNYEIAPQEDCSLPGIQNNGDIIRPIMVKDHEINPGNSMASSSVVPFQPGTTSLADSGVIWNDENADEEVREEEEEEDQEDDEGNEEEGDEADIRKRMKQKQRREERPSQCVVCGKPAYCCHFDVPSCLGCRSFFRRSVLSQRQYQCPRGGNCQNEQSKNCRACRFDRCIMGGMNLRAIKTFEERMDLQQLANDLDKRRQHLMQQQQQPWPKVLALEEDSSINLLQSLVYTDDKWLRIRYSETTNSHPDFYAIGSMMELILGRTNILAKSDNFSKRRIVPMSLQLHRSLLHTPEGRPSAKKPNWLFFDSLLCLEMARTLQIFQQLSTEAKICLLSSNGLAAIMFSINFYAIRESNSDMFVFPDGYTPLVWEPNGLIAGMKKRLFFDALMPFNQIGLRREEFLLLRVILLLQSATLDLAPEDREVVESTLEVYSKALMQLERKLTGSPALAAQRFAQLIFFLEFVQNVGHDHRKLLMNLMVFKGTYLQHPDFMTNLILGINKK